ncbi:hypothetical protein RC52_26130 [Herbaspirillum rubrisubalbicans]|nr:hypothetical protein [Herbaspirillum rubrisubalbicans]
MWSRYRFREDFPERELSELTATPPMSVERHAKLRRERVALRRFAEDVRSDRQEHLEDFFYVK